MISGRGVNEERQRPPSRAGVVMGLVFAAVLVLLSVWIAQGLIAMVKQQNCVMSGRRNCLELPER